MPVCCLTGWNGFIAQNLEKKLRRYEYSVIGLPRECLYDLVKLDTFFSINKPEFIVHTAAYGNRYDQQNDYETISANILALTSLLEVTRGYDYTGFINFSTSSVILPYETFYSATKAAGERIVRAFVNKYNKPIVTVRPFTVIGPGETPSHLIPKLIESCQKGFEMPFVKEATHDYIGIDDFCDAILLLLEHIDELKGTVVEIGTGKSTTNETIRKIVEKETGKKANVKIVDSMRPYDAKNWKANPVVLEYLNWKPKQTTSEIIRSMIDS